MVRLLLEHPVSCLLDVLVRKPRHPLVHPKALDHTCLEDLPHPVHVHALVRIGIVGGAVRHGPASASYAIRPYAGSPAH